MAKAMRDPFVLALVAPPFHHLRAASTGISNLYQHLTGLEGRNLDLCQLEWLACLNEECGLRFHRVSSLVQGMKKPAVSERQAELGRDLGE
ncbi:MAG: hypothetical protein ACRC56_07400 [Bosea sp. (in: a-proteobacteria)]